MKTRTIRKVYATSGAGGSSRQYWDHQWSLGNVSTALAFIQRNPDYTFRRLVAMAPKGSLVLEAGCGSGVVVALLRAQGNHVVGLDYSVDSLCASKSEMRSLPLVGGNVTTMPFRDGSIDCIVSLGVIEHFEDGPAQVLTEHRRVLRDGGLLLLSVPGLSLVKRWNDWLALRVRKQPHHVVRNRLVTRVEPPTAGADFRTVEGHAFHQYEFSKAFTLHALRRAGFSVAEIRLAGTRHGVGESKLVRWVIQHREPITDTFQARTIERSDAERHGPARFLWDRVVGERDVGIIGRALMRVGQPLFGHAFFVIARASSIPAD